MTDAKNGISEMRPRITVIGVGGGGGNAINNMIAEKLAGVDFIAANTDAQVLATSKAERRIQLGAHVTEGLGAGSLPEIGRAAAEESIDEIMDHLSGSHMCFVTAGMGGGTGTGAAPVIAQAARNAGILTVGVVTKPFTFEGNRRMRTAEEGIELLRQAADTVIVIPNQNLFRIADAKTTFADAFMTADRVLYAGVGCITDLIVKEGLINLDFADVKSVMRGMGRAMMGTGEAAGESRALKAAEAAIANPLLDDISMRGARGVLISISGGSDMTLFEVDEAASRIRPGRRRHCRRGDLRPRSRRQVPRLGSGDRARRCGRAGIRAGRGGPGDADPYAAIAPARGERPDNRKLRPRARLTGGVDVSEGRDRALQARPFDLRRGTFDDACRGRLWSGMLCARFRATSRSDFLIGRDG
jgi:cell division protein FtsZ